MREYIVQYERVGRDNNNKCDLCRHAIVGEIVRCKDCEWRYVKGNTTNYYWCRENDCPVDDNDFCSWAKMKGGAE